MKEVVVTVEVSAIELQTVQNWKQFNQKLQATLVEGIIWPTTQLIIKILFKLNFLKF